MRVRVDAFPDARPNSPEAWPANAVNGGGVPRDVAKQQKAANDKDAARRASEAAPRPTAARYSTTRAEAMVLPALWCVVLI